MKRLAAIITAVFLLFFLAAHAAAEETVQPTTEMTVRQIAHGLGLKGRDLAELLGLPGEVDKDTPLADLGITQEQIDSALEGQPTAPAPSASAGASVNTDMTLQEAAHTLGTTGRELAHVLGLPVDADKQVPLKNLGIQEEDLLEAARHMAGEDVGLKWIKYPVWVLISVLALVLLLGGRAGKRLYLSALAGTLIVTGFSLGKAPNPMESVIKLFKTAVGVYPDVADKILVFLFFCLLSVVGNKIICGWGCPFGALQELLYELPLGRTVGWLRRKQLPFIAANSLRTALFAVFILVIFGVAGSGKGVVLYHYFNPFNLFDMDLALISVSVSILFFTAASLVAYRTFCQFICPFGFISWLLERFSLAGVRVNRSACTQCRVCAAACPLEAMKGRLDSHRFPADCFSCARCLRSCGYGALHYTWRWGESGK